jgi:nitrate reductase NapE component
MRRMPDFHSVLHRAQSVMPMRREYPDVQFGVMGVVLASIVVLAVLGLYGLVVGWLVFGLIN